MKANDKPGNRTPWLVAGLVLMCLSCVAGMLFPKPIPMKTLNGKVLTQGGLPAKNATVFVRRYSFTEQWIPPDTTVSADNSGVFHFKVGFNETSQLWAYLPGEGIGAGPAEGQGSNLIRLVRGGPIAFTAVDENGDPMAGLRIQPAAIPKIQVGGAKPSLLFSRLGAVTDSQGKAILSDISNSGYVRYEIADHRYAVSQEMRTRGAIRDMPRRTLVVGPGCTVSGTVTLDDQPLPGVFVTANTPQGGSSLSATADNQGRFALEGVPAGEININVFPGAFSSKDWLVVPVSGVAKADNSTSVDIKAEAGAEVSGTVVDSQGNPVKGVEVSFPLVGEDERHDSTAILWDENGFDLRIPAGRHHVFLDGGPLGEDQDFTIAKGEVRHLKLAFRSRFVDISCSVIDVSGRPVPGANVILFHTNERQPKFMAARNTDREGKVSFNVREDELKNLYVRASRRGLFSASRVPLTGNSSEIHVRPISLGSVRGQIEDASGRPLPSAFVGVIVEGQAWVIGNRSEIGSFLRKTRPDGEFEFKGFYPGVQLRFTARAKGFVKSEVSNVLVKDGTVVLPPIRLEPSSR